MDMSHLNVALARPAVTSPANAMRSAQRALDLLNVLQTYQHPVRLSNLARHAGLHVTTVERMLTVLVDNGFAIRWAGGYRPRCPSPTPSWCPVR